MSTINDGGPAFPWLDPDKASGLPAQSPGMSLRAYFAGQALAALPLVSIHRSELNGQPFELRTDMNEYATIAVAAADALIAKLAEVP